MPSSLSVTYLFMLSAMLLAWPHTRHIGWGESLGCLVWLSPSLPCHVPPVSPSRTLSLSLSIRFFFHFSGLDSCFPSSIFFTEFIVYFTCFFFILFAFVCFCFDFFLYYYIYFFLSLSSYFSFSSSISSLLFVLFLFFAHQFTSFTFFFHFNFSLLLLLLFTSFLLLLLFLFTLLSLPLPPLFISTSTFSYNLISTHVKHSVIDHSMR